MPEYSDEQFKVQTGFNWAQLNQQRDLAQSQLANSLSIAKGGWAVQREGIAAQLKLGMAQLKFQKERMNKLEIPDLESQIRVREHEMMMAEKIYDLNRATLGEHIVEFEASLGGPDNWVQAANYARGVKEGGYASFVDALLKNQAAGPAFGETAGIPDKVTLESLSQKLGAGALPSGAPSPNTGSGTVQESSTYQGIKTLLGGGGSRLAAGTLESLDPNELAMVGSVAKDTGLGEAGMQRWLRDYQNSRVGTENPQLA